MRWLALFMGGGLGAILRFALSAWVGQKVPGAFPWGTLLVNLTGCLAIGLLATLAEQRGLLSPTLRLFAITGLLGGFTTFSAFGLETWQLLGEGRSGLALAYVGSSVVFGFAAVAGGVLLVRSW